MQVVDRGVAPKVEHDVQAVRVDAHDQAGHDLLDDLAKSKGDDSQVVAAQAKHRNTDEESKNAAATVPTAIAIKNKTTSF